MICQENRTKKKKKKMGCELRGRRQNAKLNKLTIHLLYLSFVQIFFWWFFYLLLFFHSQDVFSFRVEMYFLILLWKYSKTEKYSIKWSSIWSSFSMYRKFSYKSLIPTHRFAYSVIEKGDHGQLVFAKPVISWEGHLFEIQMRYT